MISASESLSHSPLVAVQPAKNSPSLLLKVLIIAIAAVAGSIFGFLLAALVGAFVGSLVCVGIAFVGMHLLCIQRSSEAVLDEESQDSHMVHQASSSMEAGPSAGEEPKTEGEVIPHLAERVDALNTLLDAVDLYREPLGLVNLEGYPSDIPSISMRSEALQNPQTLTAHDIGSPLLEAIAPSSSVQLVEEPQAYPMILSLAETNSSYFVQMLSLHRGNSLGTTSHKNLGTVIEQLTASPFTSAVPFLPVTLSDSASACMHIVPMGKLTVRQNQAGIDPLFRCFDLPFDPVQELAIAYQLPGNSQSPNREDIPAYLQRLLCAIVRVMSYGEISNDQEVSLKNHLNQQLLPIFASPKALLDRLSQFDENKRFVSHLNKQIETPTSFYNEFDASLVKSREIIKDMGRIVSTVKPLPFTPAERDLFKHPCSLVFASTRSDPALDLNFLRMGPDLQYVYAPAEDMERVQAVLKNPADGKPYDIEVRDLATLSMGEE